MSAKSEKKLLNFGLRLLDLMGMNPLRDNPISRLLGIVILALCASTFLLMLIEFVNHGSPIEAFQTMGEPMIANFQSVVKALYLIKKRHILRDLIRKIWKFKKVSLLENDLQKDFDNVQGKIGKIFKLYFTTFFLTGIAFCVIPWMQPKKTLPFNIYDFANLKESPKYEIAYFLGCATVVCALCTVNGWDIIFYSCVTYIHWELKVIIREFENLKGEDKNIRIKIASIVRHHNFVLSCIPDLNSISSMVFLVQFMTLVLANCASLFVTATDYTNTLVLMQQPSFLGATLVQLFCASLAGSLLTEQSQSIATSVFHAPFWRDAPITVKKEIVTILRMSQKFQGLSMGGMVVVDLRLFGNVLKISVSFLNAILALQAQKE